MTSSDLYRHITDLAHDSPGWVHSVAEIGTDAGLLVLLGMAVFLWWRARHRPAREMALALLVPVTTALAYGISEVAKTLVDEERPCRAVANAAPPIAACPEPGDWSFPSNHATLAAALAVGVVFVARRTAWPALVLAALLAFSRVFVGVHYPHDVLAGFGLGALVAAGGALLGAAPLAARVERVRRGAVPADGPAGSPHRRGRAADRPGRGGWTDRPARFLTGPGSGVGVGSRPGSGSGSGSGVGPRYGAGEESGSHYGAGAGSRPGAGVGFGADPGPGVESGSGYAAAPDPRFPPPAGPGTTHLSGRPR